jgi:hypothetical protein
LSKYTNYIVKYVAAGQVYETEVKATSVTYSDKFTEFKKLSKEVDVMVFMIPTHNLILIQKLTK